MYNSWRCLRSKNKLNVTALDAEMISEIAQSMQWKMLILFQISSINYQRLKIHLSCWCICDISLCFSLLDYQVSNTIWIFVSLSLLVDPNSKGKNIFGVKFAASYLSCLTFFHTIWLRIEIAIDTCFYLLGIVLSTKRLMIMCTK